MEHGTIKEYQNMNRIFQKTIKQQIMETKGTIHAIEEQHNLKSIVISAVKIPIGTKQKKPRKS